MNHVAGRAEATEARSRPGASAEILPAAPPIDILGVPVAPATLNEALDYIERHIESNEPCHIGVVNAAKLVNMRRDPELRDAVLASSVIYADGASIVLASRLLGCPLPERVTGIDLMMGLLARANAAGHRVYCLGATEDVSQRVAAVIEERFPNVRLVGRRNGYFSADEEQTIADEIERSGAQIVFVAISSPKKERFMARWPARLPIVTHGVGGSFDVLAGVVRRAPPAWQKYGLEWLYRTLQEPRRLWKRYLVTNTLFGWLVLGELARRTTRTRS